MVKKDSVVIAKVTGVHGLRGKLKVFSYSGDADALSPGIKVTLKNRGEETVYTVVSVSAQKKNFLLSLKGLDTIESAQKLIGSKILIKNSALPELPEGTYYWKDLIGLRVNSVDGDSYGEIKTIMETGSNDVFVVKDGDNEILIPFIKNVVSEIDVEKGTVLVDLPEGLLDL